MTLKDRRRALMGVRGGLTLADLNAGDKVKIGTTYYFIVLGADSGNNILLMREFVLSTAYKMAESTSNNTDYDGSIVDTYCSETIYGLQADRIKAMLADTSFSYKKFTGTTESTKSISRKIFVPTRAFVETTYIDALKEYKGTTSAGTARIATDAGGTKRKYWVCDASARYNIQFVQADNGAFSNQQVVQTAYVRPIMSFRKTAPVRIENNEYVL